MMHIGRDRHLRYLAAGGINASFEFFPPKGEKAETALWEAIRRLEPMRPRFVSVTYGAGGSTQERTLGTLKRLVGETSLPAAGHLTCVGASKAQVDEVIRTYWEMGVRHIVALRGDPPEGPGTRYVPHPAGYRNAADLVAGIKRIANFEISVSAYPEKHPESASLDVDIDNLKAKVDAGATRAITQFFFDNAHYFRYLERVRRAGITIPIVPGIVPIHNFNQILSFATRCGTTIPELLARRFDGLEGDPETGRLVAAAVAAEQVMDLAGFGIKEFHFYTLNRGDLVYAICHLLGLRPKASAPAAAA